MLPASPRGAFQFALLSSWCEGKGCVLCKAALWRLWQGAELLSPSLGWKVGPNLDLQVSRIVVVEPTDPPRPYRHLLSWCDTAQGTQVWVRYRIHTNPGSGFRSCSWNKQWLLLLLNSVQKGCYAFYLFIYFKQDSHRWILSSLSAQRFNTINILLNVFCFHGSHPELSNFSLWYELLDSTPRTGCITPKQCSDEPPAWEHNLISAVKIIHALVLLMGKIFPWAWVLQKSLSWVRTDLHTLPF